MFKKFFLIGVVSIIALAMMSSIALARCRYVLGQLRCSDVCAETILSHVPNPDQSDTHVCSALFIDALQGQAYNPALNSSQAEGVSFFPYLAFSASEFLTFDEVDDKGDAVKTLCFTDHCAIKCLNENEINPECYENCNGLEGLYEKMDEAAGIDPELCQFIDIDGDKEDERLCQGSTITVNPQWWLDTYSYSIETAYVYFSFYSYGPNGQLKSSGGECQVCSPPEENVDNTGCGLFCKPALLSDCEERNLVDVCQDAVTNSL